MELEELKRFQKFMLESPINKVFLKNTINFGIIDTSGGGSSNDFKVEQGSSSGTIKISNISRAYTSEGLIIEQSPIDNYEIPSNNKYWLKIRHKYDKLEEGSISVNSQGVVTGLGTKFKDVLRGQSTEVPVKIKLMSSNNTAVYEVVDVINDTNIILQGDSFVPESGISYYVIGSTPIGETVTSDQLQGLYSYDSCEIVNVLETVEGIEPGGLVSGKEFWIARVINSSGTISIEDKRDDFYWKYYIRGVSDKLDKNNNLSELTDPSIARVNLGGLLTEEEIQSLLSVDTVGWLGMSIGSKIKSDSQIKIKRRGDIASITGTFSTKTTLEEGDIIASIAYTSIGYKAAPSTNIYFQIPLIESQTGGRNRGLHAYIEKRTSQDIMFIRLNESVYMTSDKAGRRMQFTVTYIGG